MPLRRLLSIASIALASLFVVLAPRLAHAQQVQILQSKSLPRVNSGGGGVSKRDPSLNPEGINLKDCHDGLQVQFPLSLSGYATGDVMEAWATDSGGDCTQNQPRATAPIACYRLNVSIPLTPNPTINIPVKDIIAGLSGTSRDASGCRLVTGVTPVTVYFLLFRGGDTQAAAANDKVSLNVKTVGPDPPSGIRVQPGDGRITITWDQTGGEAGGLTDILGVKAYADTAPAQAASTPSTSTTVCDAGTFISDGSDETGAEAGTTVTFDGGCSVETTPGAAPSPIPSPAPGLSSDGVTCSDSAFTSTADGGKIIPDDAFDQKYLAKKLTGVTGNTLIATDVGGQGFQNGKMIAVAIAGIDAYDNVGTLSTPLCQFPEQTQDFWQEYKGAGGGAGGCAVATDAVEPAATLGVFALALAVAVSIARRKRSTLR